MQKYPLKMRVMHWIMALLILTLLCVGLWMTGLASDDPRRAQIYPMHKSFGICALLLVIFRLAVRVRAEVPPLPKEINAFDGKLAAFTYFLLYVAMFAMPLSGYLMSELSGYHVAFFSLPLPTVIPVDKELGKLFHSVHEYGGYTLIGLIALHLAGNTKHMIFEKVNLLKRIW